MAFQQLEDSIRNILKRLGVLENGGGSTSCTPAGSILAWSVATIPANYAEANGQALSRSTYSDLFAIIGTSFGAGDGSTTYNVPNLSGRSIVAYDVSQLDFDTVGKTGGDATHDHGLSGSRAWALLGITGSDLVLDRETSSGGFTGGTRFAASGGVNGSFSTAYKTQLDGATDSASSLQPYMALKYIIKLSGGIGVIDNTAESVLIARVGALESTAVNQTGWVTVPTTNSTGWQVQTCRGRFTGSLLLLDIYVKRTGSTISAGSDGNFSDSEICVIGTGYRPTDLTVSEVLFSGYPRGYSGYTARLQSDGGFDLTGGANSNSQVATNGFLQFTASFYID
jgi:microcystin-dependent protein